MISVFLDTNILFSRSTDFTVAGFLFNIESLISEIEVNDIYDQVRIVIPRIVIEELKKQQLDSYSEQAVKVKNLKLTEQKIEVYDDYETVLSRIFELAVSHLTDSSAMVKTIIAEYPPDRVLNSLIKRALDKNPPFEGKEKESDKGFKDAIIWETLLAFKEQNPQDTVILFSKDVRITNKFLKNEYASRFSDEIYLIQRKDMNSYNDILRPILKLIEAERIVTYAQALNEHLLSLICVELIEPLYDGVVYHYHDIDYEIDNVDIGTPEIIDIIDDVDRIIYTVSIPTYFRCSNREGMIIDFERLCSFDFTYSLNEKYFRLKSFEYPDGNVEELANPLEIE